MSADEYCFIEPGGMNTLTASKAGDDGVYIQADASDFHDDTMILVHLPPVEARALAAWLLRQYGIPQAAPTEARTPVWKTLSNMAPPEGSTVLCYWPGMIDGQEGVFGVAVYQRPGYWHEQENDEDDYREPTHWMPLPSTPSPPREPT